MREGEVLRESIELLQHLIEEIVFLAQNRAPLRGKTVREIDNHRTEPARDLHIRSRVSMPSSSRSISEVCAEYFREDGEEKPC